MRFFSTFPNLSVILIPGRSLLDPVTGLPSTNVPTKNAPFKLGIYETTDPVTIRLMLQKLAKYDEQNLRKTFSPILDGEAARAEFESYMQELEADVEEGEKGKKVVSASDVSELTSVVQELMSEIENLKGQLAAAVSKKEPKKKPA